MSETPRFHQYEVRHTTPGMEIDNAHTTRELMQMSENTITDFFAWSHKAWELTRRPFYNVYPAVVKCLGNTSLAFSLRQLTRFFEPTAICLPEGYELYLENQLKVSSIIVSVIPPYTLDPLEGLDHPICRMVANVTSKDGRDGLYYIHYSGDGLLSDQAAPSGEPPTLLRLCLGVIMLSKDPEFAKRILLNRDRKRIDRLNTPEKMKLAVDRAIRNGRNGWTIGEHLEVSPHTRRPHFAIRWTGPGRKVPKLRPIKGCVVNRARVYPIPTGYMDG